MTAFPDMAYRMWARAQEQVDWTWDEKHAHDFLEHALGALRTAEFLLNRAMEYAPEKANRNGECEDALSKIEDITGIVNVALRDYDGE